MTPKLTTVAQDIPGKAVTAVRMLLDGVEIGEKPAGPLILDVRLVERASTAPAGGRRAGHGV